MKQIKSFSEPVSFFSKVMYYNDDLKFYLEHKNTVTFKLENYLNVTMGIITGCTPKTYYSGNRLYGKYIFILPEDVRVVKTVYQDFSNAAAFEKNKSAIKLPYSHSESVGFDFYLIENVKNETETSYIEVPKKLQIINFVEFGELSDEIFIKNAIPDNLNELIEGFPYQTSGWLRNEDETHLYAATVVNGYTTFIPFAWHTDDLPESQSENLGIKYIKRIK